MSEPEVQRAQQLLDLRRYEEAARAVSAVLARSPEDAGAHLVAAWAARALNRPEEAWEHARSAAQSAPDDAEALVLMALADLDTEDPARLERARGLARRAVALEPSNPLSHLALVHTLLDDEKSNAEARAAADRALRAFPENALFLTLAAKSRLISGHGTLTAWDQEDARALIQQALRIEPTHTEARHLLGALDDAWGRGTSALRGLSDLLAEDPTSMVAHERLRDWVLRTARIWSVGLGVAVLTSLWSTLGPDEAGHAAFSTLVGTVSLLAVAVRVASAHVASGGATTRTANGSTRTRWATRMPIGAAVMLAVTPHVGGLAVPLLLTAGAMLVVGLVIGTRE